MNLTERREIAAAAVRHVARKQGEEPSTLSADQALSILDGVMRSEPASIASVWYENATEHQILLFKQEWRAWCTREQQDVFFLLHKKGSSQFDTDWLAMNLLVKEAAQTYGLNAQEHRLALSGIAYRCCMAFATTKKSHEHRILFFELQETAIFRLIPGVGQTYQKVPTQSTEQLCVLHAYGADGRTINAVPFPFTASECAECLFIPASSTVFVESE